MTELHTVEADLTKMSDDQIKEKIEKENQNLINYAKNIRVRGMIPKYSQASVEEQIAKENHCKKINGKWVQLYPEFKVPKQIKNLLS